MKKTFPCGHKGKGAYCHRCADEMKARERAQAANDYLAQKRQESRATRVAQKHLDVIDLSALDHLPALQESARRIIQGIRDGQDYRTFQGKLLVCIGRQVISIPVGRKYRLLLNAATRQPLKLCSHENYNNITSSGKTLRATFFAEG